MTLLTRQEKQHLASDLIHGKHNKFLTLALANPLPDTKVQAHMMIRTTDLHLMPGGAVSGGLLTACLDTTSLLACLNVLHKGEYPPTISSLVQFPATVQGEGIDIHFKARVIQRTRRMIFCEGEATMEDTVVAKGTFVKSIVPPPLASKL